MAVVPHRQVGRRTPPGYGLAWSILGAGGLALVGAMGLRAAEHRATAAPAPVTAPSAGAPAVRVLLPSTPAASGPSPSAGQASAAGRVAAQPHSSAAAPSKSASPHPPPANGSGAVSVSVSVLAPIRAAVVSVPLRVLVVPGAPPFPTVGDPFLP